MEYPNSLDNIGEALSLFQGITLLKELGATRVIVMQDSSIIIPHMRDKLTPKDALKQIFRKANEAVALQEGERRIGQVRPQFLYVP